MAGLDVQRLTADLLERLERVQPKGTNEWTASCPCGGHEHNDAHPSLSVSIKADKLLVYCQVFGKQHDYASVLAKVGLDPRDYREGGGSSYLSKSHAQAHTPGVTVADYARHVMLPADFLAGAGVGLREMQYLDQRAVRVPYRSPEGEEVAVNFRLSLDAKGERFRWRKGSKKVLYGLWRLGEARAAGYVILAEGESDVHTLWHAGLPALGLPGANSWNESRDAHHFDGLPEIFVVIEPDSGGAAVLDVLARSSIDGRARLLSFNDRHKDPRAVWTSDPDLDRFRERIAGAMLAAPSFITWMAERADANRRTAWERCSKLANDPEILSRFARDLAASGFAGSTDQAKLVFLAVTSRVLARPLCVAVKGVSASGKSFLVERALEFFPASAFIALSSMSEHALIYWDEPLQHRVLVIYEGAGLQGDLASYLVRSLISEGRLAYPTVEKTPEGLKGRMIEREGPTGLILTSTAVAVHPENETRLMSITVSDTADQTKQVMRALASEVPPVRDISGWHALQEWVALGPSEATVPFAPALAEAVPPLAVRLRRDFGALLTLIKAHAILHQARRNRDRSGRVIATLQDYEIVRDLVADAVAAGVEATVPATVRELVRAVDEHGDTNGITYRRLAELLHIDRSAVSRRARQAGSYVRNLEERRGRAARIVTGEPMPDDMEVLPTMADLAIKLQKADAA